MKNKRISIFIVPGIKKVRRLSIPKWLPKIILIFIICSFSIIGFRVKKIHTSYNNLKEKYNNNKKEVLILKEENKNKDKEILELKSSTKILREKTEEVEEKLIEIDKLQRELEKISGVKSPSRGGGFNKEKKSKNLKPELEMEALKKVLNDKEEEVKNFIVDVEEKLDDLEKVPDFKPVNGRLTSAFGYRRNPFGQGMQFHQGLDIANKSGTIIRAAGKGTIVFSNYKSGYGKTIIIEHGNGYKTLYGHCQELLVNEGDSVEKGQAIAEMGSTGNSTGSHLHFELHKDGKPIDPFKILK